MIWVLETAAVSRSLLASVKERKLAYIEKESGLLGEGNSTRYNSRLSYLR